MLCAAAIIQIPAYAKVKTQTSIVNDYGGNVPVILDQKYWYKVHFQGTKAQFNAISKNKSYYGDNYRHVDYIYCTDGSIKTH